MNPAMHSTASNDHRTPEYFLDLVRKVAPIYYDPASQQSNPTGAEVFSYMDPDGRPRTRCREHGAASVGYGGLTQQWASVGLTYVNPPYGRHLGGKIDESAELRSTSKCDDFVHREMGPNAPCCKCVKGRVTRVIGTGTGWARKMAAHNGEGLYLLATRTDAAWFKRLHRWCAWRLDWSSPSLGHRIKFAGNKDSAPFPSTVFYRGPNVTRFLDVFGPHGTILPGPKTQATLVHAATGGGL